MALNTMTKPARQRFPMGQLLMSRDVSLLVESGRLDPARYISRHRNGDWGDISDHDWRSNDLALNSGEDRLFSSYDIDPGLKLWIITEWDRSVTTLMLPGDY